MPKFSHAYDIGFEVISSRDDAADVTPTMIRDALLARIRGLKDDELIEAASWFDSMEIEDAA